VAGESPRITEFLTIGPQNPRRKEGISQKVGDRDSWRAVEGEHSKSEGMKVIDQEPLAFTVKKGGRFVHSSRRQFHKVQPSIFSGDDCKLTVRTYCQGRDLSTIAAPFGGGMLGRPALPGTNDSICTAREQGLTVWRKS